MKWRFQFHDNYNGDHFLIGCGGVELRALHNAIQNGKMCYPFPFGGGNCISHPGYHRVLDVEWCGSANRWRISMDTGDENLSGRYACIPFTIWAERGELLTETRG